MKNKKSGPSGYFPDDCWELIFHKLREDDERDLDSISLVSKRFLSISNWVKQSLNVSHETLPLLPNLLQRFQNIETIVITASEEIDGLVDLISQSGLLNLRAMKFPWLSTKPLRDGFKSLASNKNIKNNLKVLDCSGLTSMQDNDLLLIADCFPRLEELKICANTGKKIKDRDEVAGCITDDGVLPLASKLKELKKIVIGGNACFLTDQSLISLSTNCVKLTRVSLSLRRSGEHRGDGISFVMRHSPNLTSLSLGLWSSQHSAFPFSTENAFANAKNLHSLTMSQDFISAENVCLVAKACPPLKKLKLGCFEGQYSEIHGALQMLLQACQLTLEELTIIHWSLTDTGIGNLAQYLSNLTSIIFYGSTELTGTVAFYTLTKSCPLLEILKMTNTRYEQEMDLSFPDYLHKNCWLRHLDISGNMWLTDTTLENFGQVCPNLQFLDVGCCKRLTNFGIGKVLRRCPAITQLNIFFLNISDVFGSYSDHSVVNLKTLAAQATQIDDLGMAMIGNRCPNLQDLEIGHCKQVTDKGVMEVVRNCERLRTINLRGCEKVNTYILAQMVFSRPSLRIIGPTSREGLSEQMIKTFLSFGCRLG